MKAQIHKPTNNQINTSMARRSFLRLSSELASVVPVAALARGYLPINKPPIEKAPVNTEVPHHIGVFDTTAVPIKPFKVYEATLPAVDLKPVKQVDYYSSNDALYIAEDVLFQSLNFSGTVPGPVLVLNQGDEVQFSLTNKSVLPHSIDFHAALTPPNKNYISIMPGDTHKFNWKANYPGGFVYHCGTPFVLAHMCMGMYGATIVKPNNDLRSVECEFVLVQSEFYVSSPVNVIREVDVSKAMSGNPDYVTFNGYANQYLNAPLTAKVGELIRIWVINAGPSHFSAFHVIGTIFEAAYQDGNPANKMFGMQTVIVYPGGGMMVELRISEAGNYPFVTHAFNDASKGAIGMLVITES